VEIYHALSDGLGAVNFAKLLACRYLQIKHQMDTPEIVRKANIRAEEEDGYLKYYKETNKSPNANIAPQKVEEAVTLENLLSLTGKKFFINYYFKLKNWGKLDIYDSIVENYAEETKDQRINAGQEIFERGWNIKALKNIILDSSSVDEITLHKAEKLLEEETKLDSISPYGKNTESLDNINEYRTENLITDKSCIDLIVDYFINEQGLEANVEIEPNGDKIITINYCINYLWTLCIKVDEAKKMIRLYTPFCSADSLKKGDIYSQLNEWNSHFLFIKFFVENTSMGTFVIAEQDVLLTGKEFVADFVSAIADDFIPTIDGHLGEISINTTD
jgi:hypothetical protein